VSFTEDGTSKTILRVATGLFAALGYDGTSMQQIADTAGVDVATVNRLTGGKRALYTAVMDHAAPAEHDAIRAAIAEAADTDAGTMVHTILDAYVDFCAANRDVVSLWMHRWLADATDMPELEQRYARPLTMMIVNALLPYRDEIDDRVDLLYVAQSIIWLVKAFARGGVVDEKGRRCGFDNPEVLAKFRAHLHLMVHRTLMLP
jgi:AcrR family transcriptional regulator